MRGKPVLSVVLTDDDFLADNSTLKTVLGGLLLTYFEKMFHSSFPAYALFFLFFLKWRSARTHQFHPLCQNLSTVAQPTVAYETVVSWP